MRWFRILATASAIGALAWIPSCGHSMRNPAPFPPIPDGACDHPDAPAPRMGEEPVDIIPHRRVAPIYPRRALRSGVQGWVCLEFTITKAGTVREAHVISSAPEGYFEKAALDAIKQWEYPPKVVDDEVVERAGVRTRLSFALAR